jgi:hypothetical protein
LQIEALRVVLSTVLTPSAVQGNEFVSQDIVSGGESGRNLNHPAVVVGNQLVVPPGSRNSSIIDETHTINLEEFQCRLVNSLA